MSAFPARARQRPPDALGVLGAAAIAAVAVMIGAAIAIALYRVPPSWFLVAVVGFGLLGTLALAVARFEAAVALGFLIFGVVAIEPAPTDGVFAVVIAVALVTGRFDLSRVPLAAGGLLGLYVALNLLSAVEAVDPEVAGRFLAITLYLAVFSVWFTAYLDSERRARAVVRAYVGPAAVFGIVASLALFVPFPGAGAFLGVGEARAQGLFEDPNVFAPFLIPAALILLEEILNPRLLRSGRALKWLMFLGLAAGVLFSYSRAAWANLVVGLLVLFVILALRRGGGRKAVALLLLVVVAGATAVGAIAVTGSIDFLHERAQFQAYDVERFGAQRTGIALAEQYPFGIGPGQFDVLVDVSAHSTYVRTLAEQGFLGLVTLIALFLATLVFAARNAVLGRDSYGIGSAALLAAWVGILANSFVVDTVHWRHLWFVAALIWVGAMRPAPPGPAYGDGSGSRTVPGRLAR
jgi:O-antigen ligase